MKQADVRNLAASVRQRLHNRARERREEFNLVLTKYGLERLLYRLSVSKHRQLFVLKGALLFEVWTDRPYRATRDADLEGLDELEVARLVQIFHEICERRVQEDGLRFTADSVRGERIREDQTYEGVRLHLEAMLENARIPLQVDVAFGDAITPAPVELTYPTLLDFPAPKLAAYPRESVVAEKFEAIVRFGVPNSRMKDFYDLDWLAESFDFDGNILAKAIRETFTRRKTALPTTPPPALTAEFSEDTNKVRQWRAFLRRSKLGDSELAAVTKRLVEFLMPPVGVIVAQRPFGMRWSSGKWRKSH